MRDDFQIPNLGQAPSGYNVSFFNRLVRNIETTFTAVRSVGRGIFDTLVVDHLTVNKDITIPGDLNVPGNLTVTGTTTAPTVITDEIQFPATQVPSADPNTLDDYEEGTFTPTLQFGGASTGITYSTRLGSYTKIGRQVFFSIVITLTSKGTATGNAMVAGLPFASSIRTPIVLVTSGLTGTFTGAPQGEIAMAAPTTMNLFMYGGGSPTAFTDANFTSGSFLEISGHYPV